MDDRTVVSFDGALRNARGRTGMTAAEVAAKADMHVDHYHRIETGLQDVRLSTVVRISRALGIRITELLDGVSIVAPNRARDRQSDVNDDPDYWEDVP